MLSNIWNRDKFYTCLKLTHDVYNNQINRTVERPYRCRVDDGERKLFQMYRISKGVRGYLDCLTAMNGLRVTLFEATGINRGLRGSGIKFEVYR